eukprot:TRINITY_DN55420_c0_g1_i1.p1 TRINITY_DN55420_c0_g1~~TRINITY_DN55420_c0_g1_i1.p1  ORF type:complete len:395 (-),score=68.23 TRINITY_DN55420_c0_g1_i1:72-1256(-)
MSAASASQTADDCETVSLPSLHLLSKLAADSPHKARHGERLPSLPSTPSTTASSRATHSTYVSAQGSPGSTASSQAWEGLTSRSWTPKRVLASPEEIRPDEELLESIRADVVIGEGDSVEYIYDLIQSGEDVDQRSERGFTPLALATAAGSAPLVTLLLEKKADVTLASVDRSEIPLHYAAALGLKVICQLLLPPTQAAGALHVANSVGWTPLHLAAAAGHESILRALLMAKALPNSCNEVAGGLSALHLATLGGRVDVLESLLDYEGDANISDALRQTPLHIATRRGDEKCVSLLLRNHADVLRRGGHEQATALELAGSRSERICQLLSAYSRGAPAPRRTDARFDLPGGDDILSAYTHPVPWGINSKMVLPPGPVGVPAMSLKEEDDEDVWL